ncbi:MAG TPA: cytidylate kinase-like family protein [Gemmataceae bacterium]|nr:cytidylate kinase-like family protein [Gemmataceae bacterium]
MNGDYFKPTSVRLAEALERARQQWRMRRDEMQLLPTPRQTLGPHHPPFTIALNGDAGIDAHAVAQAVGERLGWPVYDHELVEQIAREMGIRTELVASLDEKRMNWLEELFQALFTGEMVSETVYVHHLAQTLFALAAHGECVVVGHGASQILPPATTLRVRLVGPSNDRILAVQRRCGWSREEAQRWVEQVDRERNAFVQEHFHKDPADPAHYDLILNAFRFSPAQCADLIVATLHQLQATAAAPPPTR